VLQYYDHTNIGEENHMALKVENLDPEEQMAFRAPEMESSVHQTWVQFLDTLASPNHMAEKSHFQTAALVDPA
jgi:hypothetical protein